MYGKPVTVTNTPQTYNQQEAEGMNNTPVVEQIPDVVEEEQGNEYIDNILNSKAYTDYVADIDRRRNEADNSNYFLDAAAKQLYRMPTEEEQKRIDRRNKARTVIAGVADALRILGQGIGASGGGMVNIDRGSLSDANNARLAYYKQLHADRLARNNQLLTDAQYKDAQYKLSYKDMLDKMLDNYKNNLIKSGVSVKEAQEKTKRETAKLTAQLAIRDAQMKHDAEQKQKDRESREKQSAQRNAASLRAAEIRVSGAGNSGSSKEVSMQFDDGRVVFRNKSEMESINRSFLTRDNKQLNEFLKKKGWSKERMYNVTSGEAANYVNKIISENPELREEYERIAGFNGARIERYPETSGEQEDVTRNISFRDYLYGLGHRGEAIYPYAAGQSVEDNEDEDFTNYKRE